MPGAEVEGRPLKILLYCDADLNLIDGSSIWTVSLAQVLARHPGVEVTVPLKRPPSRSLLTAPLEEHPEVRLFNPWGGRSQVPPDISKWVQGRRLRASDAAGLLAALDQREKFDLIVVRGQALARAVVDQPSLRGRIWVYVTDFTDEDVEALTTIHERAERFLCQTRQLQDRVQRLLSAGPDKFLLLPPMIPDLPADPPSPERRGKKLVYVGKFAPLWRTDEMVELTAELRRSHPDAELHVAGDKIHDVPGFAERMRQLLEEAEGVVWHQALSRDETQKLISSCDVGCSWRQPELDSSLELSTKVLEYGSRGKPVLLNRIPMHEELLGSDYPLFCNTREEFLAAASRAFEDAEAYRTAARRAWEASRRFTFSAALERIAPHLPRPAADTGRLRGASRLGGKRGNTGRTRIAIASHDWKFFGRILSHLQSVPDFEVRLDEWPSIKEHDEEVSRELAEWADVVVAEWCLYNAIWYSKNLRPGSKLLIRVHRVELDRKYPELLNTENVHSMVAVSPAFAERVKARLPSLRERVVYIPNGVDCDLLDQPKLGGSEFRLGLLGMCPKLKRLDLALDIFDRLRRRDRRYVLFVKGKLPTEYPWIWRQEEERKHYLDQMARINQSSWRDSVTFDSFARDVHSWFRKIGLVLSTSDIESFHLSVAEGMASGSVPVIRLRDEVPGL